ncbi:MAG: thioredoxin family protein [Thermoanaerobaculia bacterium]|nr:thioredoxin family protein [Thermoanaerobaculia bacterium]
MTDKSRFDRSLSSGHRWGLLALGGLGMLLFGGVAVAQEIPADSVLNGFEPTGYFEVMVDGAKVDDARVFEAQRAGSVILIRTSAFSSPVLITPRSKTVESVPMMKVVDREDGRVDILADADLRSQGSFTVDQSEITFSVEGHSVRLAERPFLLGLQTTQGILDYDATYSFRASNYKPSGPMVRSLAAVEDPVRVRIFFGSWCPHCKEMVPKALSVALELDGSNVAFEYYGLPRPFDKEPEALRADIRAVPTGIVYRGGKEIGRIEGAEWKIPELALKRMLE